MSTLEGPIRLVIVIVVVLLLAFVAYHIFTDSAGFVDIFIEQLDASIGVLTGTN